MADVILFPKGTPRQECWDGKTNMAWVYDTGGRIGGHTRDCVARAITIATGLPYDEVYGLIEVAAQKERPKAATRRKGRSSARTGVYKATERRVLRRLGWTWVPTMAIGSGCTVHLCEEELPLGTLIVAVSRASHLCH